MTERYYIKATKRGAEAPVIDSRFYATIMAKALNDWARANESTRYAAAPALASGKEIGK
jgi:hypothetical protein